MEKMKAVGCVVAVVALVIIAAVSVIDILPGEGVAVDLTVGDLEGCTQAQWFLEEQAQDQAREHASVAAPLTITGTTDCADFRSRPSDYGTVDYLVSVTCEGAKCDRVLLFQDSREAECIVNYDPGLGLLRYRGADCL